MKEVKIDFDSKTITILSPIKYGDLLEIMDIITNGEDVGDWNIKADEKVITIPYTIPANTPLDSTGYPILKDTWIISCTADSANTIMNEFKNEQQ